MGLGTSDLNEADLQTYQEITYLTKLEVMHIYNRFSDMVQDGDKELLRHGDTRDNVRVSKEDFLQKLRELQNNPFKERILDVFSSANDGSLSFDDFVNMASVFSDAASQKLKIVYAFRIYNFSNSDDITREDLGLVIDSLTRIEDRNHPESNQFLPKDLKEKLVDTVLKEADLRRTGTLSLSEFQLMMEKTPDFMEFFRIRF